MTDQDTKIAASCMRNLEKMLKFGAIFLTPLEDGTVYIIAKGPDHLTYKTTQKSLREAIRVNTVVMMGPEGFEGYD